MNKRLFRSRQEKVIGGVCGGLAEYFDVDPTIVRLATILLVLGLGFPVVAYLVGWIIIPRQPLVAAVGPGTEPAGAEAPQSAPLQAAQTPAGAEAQTAEVSSKHGRTSMSAMVPGLALVALGCFALFKGYFWWNWEDLVPVGMVVIGVYLIVRHLDFTPSKKNGKSNGHNGNATVTTTTATTTTLPTNGGKV